jgi:hypothetical protein
MLLSPLDTRLQGGTGTLDDGVAVSPPFSSSDIGKDKSTLYKEATVHKLMGSNERLYSNLETLAPW